MRKPYPSDLTDEQWTIVEPLIPVHKVGRPRTNDMREVLNANFPRRKRRVPGKRPGTDA